MYKAICTIVVMLCMVVCAGGFDYAILPSIGNKSCKPLLQKAATLLVNGGELILNHYTYLYYDEEYNDWVEYYLYTPEYKEDDLTASLKIEIKNFSTFVWDNYYLYQYSYNDNRDITEILMQRWDDNQWQNNSFEKYNYDNDYQLQSYLLKQWDENKWNNILEIKYFYESGVIVREEWCYFDVERGGSQYRGSYEYNINNKVISELWEVLWEQIWYPYTRGEYKYNDQNLIEEEIWENLTENQWILSLKYNYHYHNSLLQLIEGFIRSDDNQSWTNNNKQHYRYQKDDKISEYLYQEWTQDEEIWKDSYKYQYDWQYPNVADEITISPAKNAVSIYPNPFSSITYISLSQDLTSISPMEVYLYDCKGRKVGNFTTHNIDEKNKQLTIDNKQASGIYFLKIVTKQETIIKKVLILPK